MQVQLDRPTITQIFLNLGILSLSTILTIDTLSAEPGICSLEGCQVLLGSSYSKIFEVPVSLIPLAVSTLLLLGTIFGEEGLVRIGTYLYIPILVGGLYLTYISLSKYQTICPYCEATKLLIFLHLIHYKKWWRGVSTSLETL